MIRENCIICDGDGRVFNWRLDDEVACWVCDGTGRNLLGLGLDPDRAPEDQAVF